MRGLLFFKGPTGSLCKGYTPRILKGVKRLNRNALIIHPRGHDLHNLSYDDRKGSGLPQRLAAYCKRNFTSEPVFRRRAGDYQMRTISSMLVAKEVLYGTPHSSPIGLLVFTADF